VLKCHQYCVSDFLYAFAAEYLQFRNQTSQNDWQSNRQDVTDTVMIIVMTAADWCYFGGLYVVDALIA
jgi:hypothetical protein